MRFFSHIPVLMIFAMALLYTGTATAATSTNVDDIDAYFRVLWGLLAVLGIILILYAILKKRFSILNPRSNSVIKVIEIRPLMPKKSLCLIEVKGRQYLLGLGAEQITLVAELSPKNNDSFTEIFNQSRDREKS